MDNEQINEALQFIDFILYLDFIENLESSLKFPLQLKVCVEFLSTLLNADDVLINIMDTAGKIDLEVILNFPLDDISDYRNFASYPMLIYFESLNQVDQNFRRSMNNNSGINNWVCVVDLLPLICGNESSFSVGDDRKAIAGRYPLRPLEKEEFNRGRRRNTSSVSEDAIAVKYLNATIIAAVAPRMQSTATTVTTTDVGTVVTVAVHGLYNPPLTDHRRRVTCSAALDVPASSDQDFHNAVFAGGTYTNVTRDVNDVRWYGLDNVPATVSATGQRFENYSGVVVNSAKIPEPKNVLFKGPRFEWNTRQRFLANELSTRIFQDFVFKHRFLPVTFVMSENAATTDNKQSAAREPDRGVSNKDVNDEVVFVAFLDVSLLLQPDCTSVRCLSIVHKFDVEMLKTGRSTISGNFNLEGACTESITENGCLDETSTSSQLTLNSSQMTVTWTLPFAVIDISVSDSFYEQYSKYLTTSLVKLNIISEKSQSAVAGASPTLNKYRETLKKTIETLIKTSKKICGQNDFQDYVNELKTSKAYNSLKSFLVREIQQHIKENYKGPLIGETMQSLVNRIFVDLMNEMTKTVESFEFLHSGDDAAGNDDENAVKSPAVVVHAREAVELKRSETFYTNLISTTSAATARCNPNYWLLYASFRSRRLDFDTALECVKEVLLVDGGNRIGLFLYAAIQMTIHEDNNNGEIVLKSLIMSHGGFSEAYALLSLHYLLLEMYEASYIMLQWAKNFVGRDEIDKNSLVHENFLCWQPIGHNNDPIIKCAILLLKLGLVKLTLRCLKLVKTQCEQYHYYMAVCEYKNGNHLTSLEHLKNIEIPGKTSEIIVDSLKCLNYIELNEPSDVLDSYLSRMCSDAPRKELHLVYLKGALHCYENKRYAQGAKICQIARTVLRTPMICTLLAKCLIKIGRVEAAESALDEANRMDVKNGEVWACLMMVNVQTGNIDVAKVCYERALEYGLTPEMKKEVNILFDKYCYTINN